MNEGPDKFIQFCIMVLANLVAIALYYYMSKVLFTYVLTASECYR